MENQETLTVLENCERLIGEGRTEEALKQLVSIKERKYGKKFLVLSNRFGSLKRQFNKGIITHEEYNSKVTRIGAAVISTMQDLGSELETGESPQKGFSLRLKLITGIGVVAILFLVFRFLSPDPCDDLDNKTIFIANFSNKEVDSFSERLRNNLKEKLRKYGKYQILGVPFFSTNEADHYPIIKAKYFDNPCDTTGFFLNGFVDDAGEVFDCYINMYNLDFETATFLEGDSVIYLSNPSTVDFEIRKDAEFVSDFVTALTSYYEGDTISAMGFFEKLKKNPMAQENEKITSYVFAYQGNMKALNGDIVGANKDLDKAMELNENLGQLAQENKEVSKKIFVARLSDPSLEKKSLDYISDNPEGIVNVFLPKSEEGQKMEPTKELLAELPRDFTIQLIAENPSEIADIIIRPIDSVEAIPFSRKLFEKVLENPETENKAISFIEKNPRKIVEFYVRPTSEVEEKNPTKKLLLEVLQEPETQEAGLSLIAENVRNTIDLFVDSSKINQRANPSKEIFIGMLNNEQLKDKAVDYISDNSDEVASSFLQGSKATEKPGEVLLFKMLSNPETKDAAVEILSDNAQLIAENKQRSLVENMTSNPKAEKAISAIISQDSELKKNINNLKEKEPGMVKGHKTIKLKDGKIWLAQNLNIEIEDSYCYDKKPENCTKYGRLYTWEAAKKACQELGPGWRLPSDEEWKAITNTYGGYYDRETFKDVGDPKSAYQALMEGGSSGFAAQLGGLRDPSGNFYHEGYGGYYWSSTPIGSSNAWRYDFFSYFGKLYRHYYDRAHGYSVRCLQGS